MKVSDSEQDLLEQLKKDDQSAFTAIFERHREKVHMMAYYILKDNTEAQDVVQEIFSQLWKHRHSLQVSSSLKNYLITAARNRSLDILNKKAHYKKYIEYNASEASFQDPSDQLERNDLTRTLREALEKISSPVGKQAIHLYYLDGLSHKETSDHLNISLLSSRSHVFKALKQLREIFKHSPFEG